MTQVIEVGGLSDEQLASATAAGLDAMGRFLVDRIRDNLSRKGPPVAGDFPRSRTGELAEKIDHRVENNRLKIRAYADHAAALELGDHPFMARTLHENERQAVDVFVQAFRAKLQ